MRPRRTPHTAPLPPVDYHIVAEETRFEILHGRLVRSPPAREPHAHLHLQLAYVLAAHVARGYQGAVEMLTRSGLESDFAPDASVYPAARDPVTGGRQLEELAFEIIGKQSLKVATEKARELVKRGVRRVFALRVAQSRVLEWSRATDGWGATALDGAIDDPCFARPLPVRALLDAAAADEAVVAALIARGEPALRALEARGEARGEAHGRAEALLAVLRARGLAVSDDDEARVRSERDVAALDRWITRAARARTVAAVFARPTARRR